MGTPAYAVPTLEALIDHHEVVCVFSRPDAISKRGNTLLPSSVKEAALKHDIVCKTPRTLRDEEVVSEIAAYEPDVIVVAAYGMILPKEVLETPRYGCLNLHASLLPRWRGAAPIQRAILAGDSEAGVVLMQMEEGLDTGDYALAKRTPIAQKTTEQLTDELGRLAAAIIIEGLRRLQEGTLVWNHQDESSVTYAEKIAKSDVALHPELSVVECARRIQASSESAPARIKMGSKTLAVKLAHMLSTDTLNELSGESSWAQGDVFVTKKHLIIACQDGLLELDCVKPEGKKEMTGRDFAQGIHNHENLKWEGVE